MKNKKNADDILPAFKFHFQIYQSVIPFNIRKSFNKMATKHCNIVFQHGALL